MTQAAMPVTDAAVGAGHNKSRLGRALRGHTLRDAIAEALASGLPNDLRQRDAAMAAVETTTDAVLDAVTRAIRDQVWRKTADCTIRAEPAAESAEDAELAEATAMARERLFESYWKAMLSEHDPAARFLAALERSSVAEVARPGVLLTAYRWGLLDADGKAATAFRAWFPKKETV